jgi:hypothetical protein
MAAAGGHGPDPLPLSGPLGPDYGAGFVLTCFTDDPGVAEAADRAGVDRVGPDLERLGKEARQGGMGTRISDHRESCLPALRRGLRRAALFARTNPPHPGLREEVARLLDAGVRVLMLPHFTGPAEAEAFLRAVDGQARAVLLVETVAAAEAAERISALPADEVHFGLNDLRLGLGLPSHFEVLASDYLADRLGPFREAGRPVAVAGLGRWGQEDLPFPSSVVYPQFPRLGATGALVSRTFLDGLAPAAFPAAVQGAREALQALADRGPAAWTEARDRLRETLRRRYAAMDPPRSPTLF